MGCLCGKEAITAGDRLFFVQSRLGEGGFSYVDLVQEVTSRRTYALKRITCHTMHDEEMALKEVEVMKEFHIINLVPLVVHSVMRVGYRSRTMDILSEVLIVMPLYQGGSLQDKIDNCHKKAGRLPEQEIWHLMFSLCKAVDAMHGHHPPYAHRDIKPGNVMLTDDNTPVLMDLGSATEARVEITCIQEANTLQDIAAEKCSMLFRPPELLSVQVHSCIDERTDIWSVGCTLYNLAYLEAPFEKVHQTGGSIALAAMAGRVHFPDSSEYSAALQEMISWMMTVPASDRPFISQVLQRVKTLHNSTARGVL